MKAKKLDHKKVAEIIVQAAENKKATNINLIDLKGVTDQANNLIIMTGESSPQLKAISREIKEKLKEAGLSGLRWEGEPLSGWMILDVGTSLVHIMAPKERWFYNLEGLWGKDAIIYHY